MKYFLFVLFGFVFVPALADASVGITEVAWMGTAESQYSEWLELYNDGDAPVDLAGWKLYEAGDTRVYTFSKTIDPHSYLLLERTTASAPDAVPGINDESGSFGGGGLSNSGEDLSLKDASGGTVESLMFSSGWPAGDATTKETMQWNGSRWVTAVATPDAPFVESHVSSDSAGQASSSPVPEGTHWTVPAVSPNLPHVEFTVPSLLYSGVPYEFSIQPVLEYNYRINNGMFKINMGDGTLIESSTLLPIRHTYLYPGTYTISFSYTDPLGVNTPLHDTKSVTIQSPSIVLSTVGTDAIRLKNNSSRTVDLSDWILVFPMKTVRLPPMTILAAKADASMLFATFSIPNGSYPVTLMNPSGSVVATTEIGKSASGKASSVEPRTLSRAPAGAALLASAQDPLSAPSSTDPHEANQQKQNHTKLIIFGVALLFVIALSILLERFMARQEY